MKKILITLLVIVSCNFTQAQKFFSYKDFIDYYRENVKSTILTKEGRFLKDGKYKFEGSPKDFNFLLSYILEYNLNDFNPSDTLIYEGEIKDSIKVNIWHLILNKKGNQLDLIYSKEKDSILKGTNFSVADNKYGLNNEMIYLEEYKKDNYLRYISVGGEISSQYNFCNNKDFYIKRNEPHSEQNNQQSSSNHFEVRSKIDNTEIYSESSFYKINLNKNIREYRKESFLRYNDSCTIEASTITQMDINQKKLKEKNKNKKYDKIIWENINYSQKSKNIMIDDMIIKGEKISVYLYIAEEIKDNKLLQLKFECDNKEIQCPFTDFLKTNYYPIILYDKTPILN